jgi:hypothetical protein
LETVFGSDDAIDNINFPTDATWVMQLMDKGSSMHKDRHGFTKNMGTALAVDGVVKETAKPDVKDLNGQEMTCYRNGKMFVELYHKLMVMQIPKLGSCKLIGLVQLTI